MLPSRDAMEQAHTAVFLRTVGYSSAVKAYTIVKATEKENFPVISSAVDTELKFLGMS
uniref:Uncharacterized protein n=2 Tax=Anguilla anguilla TaxID=7936 RepID=A0A0E9RV02_ANGAN